MTDSSGRFTSADGKYVLDVSHSYDKNFRHMVSFKFVDTVADPLVPDQNTVRQTRAYLVVEAPKNGIDSTTVGYVATALTGFTNAAFLTKLIGGES